MAIKDSGNRKQYSSGAVRDMGELKGRCDLMPLDVIGDIMQDAVIQHIGAYMRTGNTEEIKRAILVYMNGSEQEELPFEVVSDFDLASEFLYLSRHFEQGAIKYGEHN